MRWSNLTNNTCPACTADLKQGQGKFIVCSRCTFKISEAKLEEFLRYGFRKQYNTVEQEQARLQELNNLQKGPFNPYRL